MAANTTVAQGICARLYTAVDEELEQLQSSGPLVQVLWIKKVLTSKGKPKERYGLIVSDGKHMLQAVIATHLNFLIEDGQVGKNSIVKLDEFKMSGVGEDNRCARLERVFRMH
jgi:replication factor A1